MSLIARRPGHILVDYQDAKPDLRVAFRNECCYCRVHEAQYGGSRNFHIDHFKPKSRFPTLAVVYDNLIYSCATCNCFKGKDWHAGNPTTQVKGYYDPRDYDYSAVLPLQPNGELGATGGASRYVIERLYLNAPHIVRLRHLIRFLNQVPPQCDAALALLATFNPVTPKEKTLVRLLEDLLVGYKQMATITVETLTTPI